MRPLLERLRDPSHAEGDEPSSLGDLCREAADEIDRMRSKLREIARCIDNRKVPRQNIMPHVKFALGLRAGDEITG